jgi:hypothetical protein
MRQERHDRDAKETRDAFDVFQAWSIRAGFPTRDRVGRDFQANGKGLLRQSLTAVVTEAQLFESCCDVVQQVHFCLLFLILNEDGI